MSQPTPSTTTTQQPPLKRPRGRPRKNTLPLSPITGESHEGERTTTLNSTGKFSTTQYYLQYISLYYYYHISHITYHLSHITYHISHIAYHYQTTLTTIGTLLSRPIQDFLEFLKSEPDFAVPGTLSVQLSLFKSGVEGKIPECWMRRWKTYNCRWTDFTSRIPTLAYKTYLDSKKIISEFENTLSTESISSTCITTTVTTSEQQKRAISELLKENEHLKTKLRQQQQYYASKDIHTGLRTTPHSTHSKPHSFIGSLPNTSSHPHHHQHHQYHHSHSQPIGSRGHWIETGHIDIEKRELDNQRAILSKISYPVRDIGRALGEISKTLPEIHRIFEKKIYKQRLEG